MSKRSPCTQRSFPVALLGSTLAEFTAENQKCSKPGRLGLFPVSLSCSPQPGTVWDAPGGGREGRAALLARLSVWAKTEFTVWVVKCLTAASLVPLHSPGCLPTCLYQEGNAVDIVNSRKYINKEGSIISFFPLSKSLGKKPLKIGGNLQKCSNLLIP